VLKDFIDYLKDEMFVTQVTEDVEIYEYEQNVNYCSCSDIFVSVSMQPFFSCISLCRSNILVSTKFMIISAIYLNCTQVTEDVEIYEYEQNVNYCSGSDIFEIIVEQVKQYKGNNCENL